MHVYKLNSENHLFPQPHISPVWTNPCCHFVCPCRGILLVCRHIQLNMCARTHLYIILTFRKLYFCVGHPLHFKTYKAAFLEALGLTSVLSHPLPTPGPPMLVPFVSFQRLLYCHCGYSLHSYPVGADTVHCPGLRFFASP